MNEVILKTVNLTKVYERGGKKVHALSDVNLQINRGDYVAIMGTSGSGKTTLLNMLGCLDKPTSGSVILDGVDITKMNESELSKIRRDKIGFVFQAFNLIPILNAIENVELPMECAKIPKDKRRKRARQLLNLVGLSERMEHRPHELSAGEQQRVAIARAFANKPSIILADEPTGNLDSKTGKHIMELLGRLNYNIGTTIIVVTHDYKMASLTGRILFLQDGRILKKEKEGTYLGRKK
ncbi:MAG: ABC transporter ATP-binding protein [Thermoplasmata archaeon]|nr:ABC transporter ATP-binding protein [Thermoplasmata archaeon]